MSFNPTAFRKKLQVQQGQVQQGQVQKGQESTPSTLKTGTVTSSSTISKVERTSVATPPPPQTKSKEDELYDKVEPFFVTATSILPNYTFDAKKQNIVKDKIKQLLAEGKNSDETFVEIITPFVGAFPHIGIYNPNNCCYVNSVLQMLYHIPEFKAYVLSSDSQLNPISSLKAVFQRLDDKSKYLAAPNNFYIKINNDILIQRDIENSILECIQEDITSREQKDTSEFITECITNKIQVQFVNKQISTPGEIQSLSEKYAQLKKKQDEIIRNSILENQGKTQSEIQQYSENYQKEINAIMSKEEQKKFQTLAPEGLKIFQFMLDNKVIGFYSEDVQLKPNILNIKNGKQLQLSKVETVAYQMYVEFPSSESKKPEKIFEFQNLLDRTGYELFTSDWDGAILKKKGNNSKNIEPACKEKTQSIQTEDHTKYLILSLKRFGNDRTKIQNKVNINKRIKVGDNYYTCEGIINHFGSLEGGHYSYYWFDGETTWWEFNDINVYKLTGKPQSNYVSLQGKNVEQTAYVLLYKKDAAVASYNLDEARKEIRDTNLVLVPDNTKCDIIEYQKERIVTLAKEIGRLTEMKTEKSKKETRELNQYTDTYAKFYQNLFTGNTLTPQQQNELKTLIENEKKEGETIGKGVYERAVQKVTGSTNSTKGKVAYDNTDSNNGKEVFLNEEELQRYLKVNLILSFFESTKEATFQSILDNSIEGGEVTLKELELIVEDSKKNKYAVDPALVAVITKMLPKQVVVPTNNVNIEVGNAIIVPTKNAPIPPQSDFIATYAEDAIKEVKEKGKTQIDKEINEIETIEDENQKNLVFYEIAKELSPSKLDTSKLDKDTAFAILKLREKVLTKLASADKKIGTTYIYELTINEGYSKDFFLSGNPQTRILQGYKPTNYEANKTRYNNKQAQTKGGRRRVGRKTRRIKKH